MKKSYIIAVLIAAFSLMAFSAAFAGSVDLSKQGDKSQMAMNQNIWDTNGKSDEDYLELWKAMKQTKFGKEMFKAMEKQDFEAMQDLMNNPEAMEEMAQLMNDPVIQEYHTEMHNNPAVQDMHNSMHGTGSMMGGGGMECRY